MASTVIVVSFERWPSTSVMPKSSLSCQSCLASTRSSRDRALGSFFNEGNDSTIKGSFPGCLVEHARSVASSTSAAILGNRSRSWDASTAYSSSDAASVSRRSNASFNGVGRLLCSLARCKTGLSLRVSTRLSIRRERTFRFVTSSASARNQRTVGPSVRPTGRCSPHAGLALEGPRPGLHPISRGWSARWSLL